MGFSNDESGQPLLSWAASITRLSTDLRFTSILGQNLFWSLPHQKRTSSANFKVSDSCDNGTWL